ncbi:MAG TPA: hypothetical protein VNA28_17305 [Solirubrobacteraceae bacterium]|nr:hypothetical protein [Solirubrobacteraceae bacterium]
MVRRPSAVLSRFRLGPVTLAFAVPCAAQAYFLCAPWLPALAAGDETVLVAGSLGVLLIAITALALLPARETVIGPLLIILGSGLLVAALNIDADAGVGAGANVVEALLAGSFGLILARLFATPMSAVAVPLLVAAIDVASVWNGPTARMLETAAARVDPLSFDLPAWGDEGSAGHLGLSDAVFLSMFAAWSERYGFRRRLTLLGMVLGLAGTPALSVALDESIPALPLIVAGYLLPNLDRIGRLLGHPRPGADNT